MFGKRDSTRKKGKSCPMAYSRIESAYAADAVSLALCSPWLWKAGRTLMPSIDWMKRNEEVSRKLVARRPTPGFLLERVEFSRNAGLFLLGTWIEIEFSV